MNTLSDNEKRLGSLMARISAACIFLSFGVQVALGDPGSAGYDSTTGGIVATLNYAQAFLFCLCLHFHSSFLMLKRMHTLESLHKPFL